MRLLATLGLIAIARTTFAAPDEPAAASPQLQADLGLTVVAVGYERPVTRQLAIQVEAGIFGTYFLPWFDLGDDVQGVGFGVRPTWFARPEHRGLYVAPYLRGVGVRGSKDGATGTGPGFAAGAFVGWALGLTDRLDLRIGAGAQYLWFRADTDRGRLAASTPFVALDLVVGYRL